MALATAAVCAAGIGTVGTGGAVGQVTASASSGWSALPSSPLSRTEVAAARIGGKVYVVGGFIPPGAPPSSVAVYEIKTGRWTIGPDMPILVNHAMVAAYKGKLYAYGGYDLDSHPLDALQRARRQIEREETGDLGRRLLALVKDLRRDQPKTDRLVVKSGGRLFFLRMDEIDWIEAAGNYVRLHVGTTSHLLRETMNAIEGRLDPEKFFRIHRSRIVNMERIQEMQPWLNGEYAVVLRTGTRLTLSRGYREKLQERLGRGL